MGQVAEQSKTINKAHLFLVAFDLSAVMSRVAGDESSKIEAEKAYRHFLLLTWKNMRMSTGSIVPSPLADSVWHVHLIFTKNYRKMCDGLVGGFIDHKPDGGDLTEGDRRRRRERTRALDRTIHTDLRFITGEFLPPERAHQSRPDMGGCDTGGCDGCESCG